ncbi:MAG TPA: hypothetical protein VK152_11600 [Paludibacter sp.]|nr:hypothetical protein [Paludibacter sp.]
MYAVPHMYYPYRQPIGIKAILITTAIILVLLIGIYFYIKKKAEDSLKDELPSQYADEAYTADESRTIRYLASSLNDDLSQFIDTGHPLEAWRQLRDSTDRIFIAVAADYKRLTGNSLRSDFMDSAYGGWYFNIEGKTLAGESVEIYNAIKARLNTLQIA